MIYPLANSSLMLQNYCYLNSGHHWGSRTAQRETMFVYLELADRHATSHGLRLCWSVDNYDQLDHLRYIHTVLGEEIRRAGDALLAVELERKFDVMEDND